MEQLSRLVVFKLRAVQDPFYITFIFAVEPIPVSQSDTEPGIPAQQ